MENSHFDSFLKYFGLLKGLASNSQTNPAIEKHQLPDNAPKT